MVRDISTVGVVGLGTMGAGIAEVLARSGLDVVTVELDEAGVARGRGHLEHSTERALSGGKLDAPGRAALLGRIRYSTSLSDLSEVDLVIEAIPESLELKAEVFAELDKITRPEVVFASNTSSLSITEIGVHTARPGKVVGMHFFNPAPVLKLVEIVKTVVTEPDVVAEVVEFAERLGKVPVVIGDRAGFIANALLFGYLNHAVRMYEQRYATREDLDAAMRFGCGYPMGPLALLDLIGLDTANEILDTMYHQSRNRLHAPAPLLKQMITAGLLGRKTGRGFYTYDAPDSPTVVSSGVVSTVDGVPPRPVARVGVVGTGTMATGIAEVFAKRGLDVVLRARSLEKAQASVARVKKSLDKAVVKGKLSEEDAAAALARITPVTDFEALADVDLVIEAVAEELPVKQAVFAALDEVVRPGAVLATTTSSLPVIECAASTSRPSDVIGLHFFNPAPVMKLVEVVSTIATAPGRGGNGERGLHRGGQTRGALRRPRGLHRQRIAVPVPQRRGEDAGSPLRGRERHRHGHEGRLRPADGPVRAAGRRRPRRLPGHPADAVQRVPRGRLRAGAAAGAPGDRGEAGPEDREGLQGLLISAPG